MGIWLYGEDHMKISDKLTDYGLSGGLFWSFQVLLFWPFGWSAADWASHLAGASPIANVIPSAATSSLSALLGILGVITIFTTGVVLDNFGSFFSLEYEAKAFKSAAKANKEWMQQLVEQHKAYVQDDWNLVLEAPLSIKLKSQIRLFSLRLFRKSVKLESKEIYERLSRAREAYVRLQSFLMAYASFPGKTDEVTQLGLKISIWNISRSTTGALAIISIEFLTRMYIDSRTHLFIWPTFVITLIVVVLAFISARTTNDAHARVCKALFAIVYIASVSACSTFQLPTSCVPRMKPSWMSVRRVIPRHMTVFPGGGSLARAR
jgi:hypothetical protein